jgi:hypothetical protein
MGRLFWTATLAGGYGSEFSIFGGSGPLFSLIPGMFWLDRPAFAKIVAFGYNAQNSFTSGFQPSSALIAHGEPTSNVTKQPNST